MLLKDISMWGEKENFKTELIEVSPGEVAGIKSATIDLKENLATADLRTESGVHRLVKNHLLIQEAGGMYFCFHIYIS